MKALKKLFAKLKEAKAKHSTPKTEVKKQFKDGEDIYTIQSLDIIGVRPFYDCTFFVVFESESGKAQQLEIVREYEDSFDDFAMALLQCNTLDQVRSLDRRSFIYYD